MKQLSARVRDQLLRMQQNEINEYHVYQKIAATVKQPGDRETLLRIADAELAHAKKWESYTGVWPSPQKGKILRYSILSRIFGYTFTLKLMENGENAADSSYQSIADEVPEAAQIAAEEQEHEQELLAILDEDRLQYVGSMVLGLNDALVELTGTLAGLSFALQNNRLIALSGLITGVSATFSMASSAYLSAKSEGERLSIERLYRRDVSDHRRAAHPAVSSLSSRQLPSRARRHAPHRRFHHLWIHLLYFGRQRSSV